MTAITALGSASSTTAYQATSPADETKKQGAGKAGHHGHHHRAEAAAPTPAPAPASPAAPTTSPSSLLDVTA